jgi:hypothetical protein
MKKTLTLLTCALLLGNGLIAQTTPPNYVSQNGLVGWWPFTGNANDQSSFANNGTVYSATLTTDRAGNANSAYAFNGSSSLIEVVDVASLRVRKLTMAVWVYHTNPNANYDAAIYKGRKSDAYGEAFSLSMEMSSAVKVGNSCQAGMGWQRGNFSGQTVPLGVWTHLCTTFDGSYLRNYINAVEVESRPVYGLIDSCIGGNMRFGYAHEVYGKAWAWPFQGKLDDIGIWNRALYPGEIVEIYKGAPVAAPAADTIISHPNTIVQKEVPSIKLAPNPARGAFVLTGDDATEPLRVSITDLVGRQVLTQILPKGEKTISLQGVAGGLYLLTVSDLQGAALLREKLIIE